MRLVLVVILVIGVVYLSGCGKKQETLSDSQVPLSVDMMTTGNVSEITEPVLNLSANTAVVSEVPLPPQAPYKPTTQEIQTALKNAGFYTVEVDGKFGPKTKKAIEEFQKVNGLKADGKVGPKTWEVLSKSLNPVVAATQPVKNKK